MLLGSRLGSVTSLGSTLLKVSKKKVCQRALVESTHVEGKEKRKEAELGREKVGCDPLLMNSLVSPTEISN